MFLTDFKYGFRCHGSLLKKKKHIYDSYIILVEEKY